MTLFNKETDHSETKTWATVTGLHYDQDFLCADEEAELIHAIDAQIWLGDLTRRVQHYGYKYNYKSRTIDLSMQLGQLPEWITFLTDRLVAAQIFRKPPDQMIVNEYNPGQGIAPHIDCEPCFDDTIASVSLGSTIVMDFTRATESIPILLQARSLVVMQEESRYQWKHGIASRKTDTFRGQKIPRGRRISLTFRQVILT